MSRDTHKTIVVKVSKDQRPQVKKDIYDPKYKEQAWAYLLDIREKNPQYSQEKIGLEMMKAGWYVGPRFGVMRQESVSRFMNENGLILQKKRPRKSNKGDNAGLSIHPSAGFSVSPQNDASAPLDRAIIAILNATTGLNDEVRAQIIKTVIDSQTKK